VRVRISALSEIPADWRATVLRWTRMNAPLVRRVDGRPAPDRSVEYLLYQTLVGAWPDSGMASDAAARDAFAGRIVRYVEKALREAKVHTSWTNPNEE
jgi:(1->4)-alpha-D-glucan 1-alpha-D-glucosylmutase